MCGTRIGTNEEIRTPDHFRRFAERQLTDCYVPLNLGSSGAVYLGIK
jgi:hypothetical protein